MKWGKWSAQKSVHGALLGALMLSVSTGAVLIMAHGAAVAQSVTPKSFSIPAGSLSQALAAFGKQSGLQVTYPSEIAAGKKSPGFSGTGTREEVLAAILKGSGLSYSFPNGATAAISEPAGDGAAATLPGAIALDTIDVGGNSVSAAAELPYQTPGSTAHISEQQIQEIRPSRPGDVFNDTPGVIAASKNTGGGVDVNIRGIQGMNRVKVMVDGTQQDSNTYRSYNGTDNRSYFDPDLISGIEIEKGPSDGPYGSGAMGGVVNMKTLTPDDILLPGTTYGFRARGGIGSNTIAPSFLAPGARPEEEAPDFLDFDNKFGSLAAAARSEHFDFVAAIVKRQHGNYFAGKNGDQTVTYSGDIWNPNITQRYSQNLPREEVPNTSEDTTSTLLKGTLKFDDHSLELGYIGYDAETGYVFPLWGQQAQRQQFNLSPTTSNRYTAKYKFTPNDNELIDFRFNVWGSDLDTKEPYQRTVGQWQNLLETSAWGGESWNTSRFDTAIGHATLMYGVEYSSSDFEASAQNVGQKPYTKVRGTRDVGGTFLRGSLDLTEWLTVNGGLRYDFYKTEAASGMADLITNEGDAVLPSVGITITPIAGVQLFGKYSEGYRPPAVREISGTGAESSGWASPNPNLRPEQSENWEFGVNFLNRDVFHAGDKLGVKAAYFENYYTDYIAMGGAYYGTSPCAIGSLCFVNFNEVTYKGIEFSSNYDAGSFFASAAINYYTEADVGDDPAQLLLQWGMGYVPPKYTLSGTVGVRLFDERLTLGTRVGHHGDRAAPYMYYPPYSTVRFQPNVTLVDLFGSYAFNDNITLDFSMENVTDQYYVDPLAVSAIPSPGRTARVGFTMKLGDTGIDDHAPTFEMTTPTNGYDWSGLYAGLSVGYSMSESSDRGNFDGTIRRSSIWYPYSASADTDIDTDSLTAGIFAGYNFQLNSPLVIGIDGSIGESDDMKLEKAYSFTARYVRNGVNTTAPLNTNLTSSMGWHADVRGRIGIAFDRLMPYIAGGLAVTEFSYDYGTFTVPGYTPGTSVFVPAPTSLKDTFVGWTFGAGVEHAMTDNLILRAEYRRNDFGKKSFETPSGSHEVELTSDEWKFGAAWKF